MGEKKRIHVYPKGIIAKCNENSLIQGLNPVCWVHFQCNNCFVFFNFFMNDWNILFLQLVLQLREIYFLVLKSQAASISASTSKENQVTQNQSGVFLFRHGYIATIKPYKLLNNKLQHFTFSAIFLLRHKIRIQGHRRI